MSPTTVGPGAPDALNLVAITHKMIDNTQRASQTLSQKDPSCFTHTPHYTHTPHSELRHFQDNHKRKPAGTGNQTGMGVQVGTQTTPTPPRSQSQRSSFSQQPRQTGTTNPRGCGAYLELKGVGLLEVVPSSGSRVRAHQEARSRPGGAPRCP